MLGVKNLSKEYTDVLGYKIPLFKGINFSIDEGKINTIVAPLGAGKSTLLKIIAGLVNSKEGEVENSSNEGVVYIPSKSSSLPWLSVRKNIEMFAVDKSSKNILSLIQKVGLEGYEEHIPHNESCGFRFRISLAAALSVNTKLILLDEPFTDIPFEYKDEIYSLVRQINKELSVTFLIATTNITEAIYLSDKIILISNNAGGTLNEINVNLPDERESNIFNTPKFNEVKTKIEQYFGQIKQNQFFKVTL